VIGVPPAGRSGLPRTLAGWLTTTDHKALCVAYAITSFFFAAVGGALSGIIRTELARPGLQFVDEASYNQLFTIHGSVMVYLFAVPFGFARVSPRLVDPFAVAETHVRSGIGFDQR